MGVSYYDGLLPVRDPGPGLREVMTASGLRTRCWRRSPRPLGRIVLAFVSDSAELSRMFAANWARSRGRSAAGRHAVCAGLPSPPVRIC